ncbi:MAG: class I SAM-dependent methyltransferase [Candidatus Saganbacteria bacterium]|nr:class I SAM-dependent methyltransferase [Candidatus Saganbacteria bacterium]
MLSTRELGRATRDGRVLLKDPGEKRTVLLSNTEQLEQLRRRARLQLDGTTQTDHYVFSDFTDRLTGRRLHAVAPLFGREDFQRDTFWQQRTELLMHMNALGMQLGGSQVVKMAMASCVQVNGWDKGVSGYYDTLLGIAQNDFTEMADRYAAGERYDPAQNVLGSPQYSHTKLFAWIYYVESLEIASVAQEKGEGIRVVELGSAFGSPIFTKRDLLPDQDVTFYGVDIRDDLLSASRRFVASRQMQGVHFAHADVTKKGWHARMMHIVSGHPADVVVSSHLLEHLPGDPKQIIGNWLRLTKKALVVSVPHTIEEVNMSDHEHNLGVEGLSGLADYFESEYHGRIQVKRDQIDAGILILIKV